MVFDCSEIISARLWVGSFVRPEDVKILQKMGITSVVNLQSDWDLASYSISLTTLQKAYAQAQIYLNRFPIPDFDRQSLGDNLPQAVEELEKALIPSESRVYVHCTAGINRAPTLAAAYLIKAMAMPAHEAYQHVTSKRDCSPYLDTLQEYETSLKKEHCV